MSAVVFTLLCALGGLGAVCRFALDHLIRTRVAARLPIATIAINLLGSFALGVLAALAARQHLDTAYAVLGVGFLGGFTTFSTHSVETVRLMLAGSWRLAMINVFGTLIPALALAWLGLTLAA